MSCGCRCGFSPCGCGFSQCYSPCNNRCKSSRDKGDDNFQTLQSSNLVPVNLSLSPVALSLSGYQQPAQLFRGTTSSFNAPLQADPYVSNTLLYAGVAPTQLQNTQQLQVQQQPLQQQSQPLKSNGNGCNQ